MRAYYLRQAASWAPCSFRHKGGRQHSGMSLRKAPHGNPRRSRGGNSRRNSQQASRACPRQNFRPSFRPRRMPPQARCGCFPRKSSAPVAARGGEPLPARTPQTPPHYARTGCATGGVPDPIPAEIPARPEQANRALGNRQHVGQQLEPLPGSVAGRPDNQLPDAARHESRQAHRPDESPGQDAATKTIKNSNNKELHKNGRKSTGKCG